MPDAKKCPGRFNLKFNLDDPAQRAAAELLEKQGRKNISRFIAAALAKTESGDIPAAPKRKRGRPPGSKNTRRPHEPSGAGSSNPTQAKDPPVVLPPVAGSNPAMGEDSMLEAMLHFG